MGFATNCSLVINKNSHLYKNDDSLRSFFFNEELGAIVVVPKSKIDGFSDIVKLMKLDNICYEFMFMIIIYSNKIMILIWPCLFSSTDLNRHELISTPKKSPRIS